MHYTAIENAKRFFDVYSQPFLESVEPTKVVEIGSQDVNGSIRQCSPSTFQYIGVDFVEGKGVDVLLDDPYTLPFEDKSVSIVVSSSCLEHSEFFWLLYLEMLRILKDDGILYINVPSNGQFHRWPVDCWRFYPDSGIALAKWARRVGFNCTLLESFTTTQLGDQWNDFVAVTLKDESFIATYPRRVIRSLDGYWNGYDSGNPRELINFSVEPEDRLKHNAIKAIIDNRLKVR
jgi:SAM-dependent methyltransferase